MKLSLNWLRDFVDVTLPVPELARRLIDATAEVESWHTIGADWDPERIRVAEVVAVAPHPNADRLRLATVETGTGRQQVVCGAPNLAVGQKVAFATEGALLRDGHTGEPAKLKLRPIRGVDSAGMVLSEKELGLGDNHDGILVLPPDAPNGRPLVEQLGDVVFDISTWANRGDLLSVLGFAREVSALTGAPLREPNRSHGEGAEAASNFVSVTIDDADLCPRFTASVIRGVTIGPSPLWLQERLQRLGMRSINNVVDITNYVMLETGQPLHAYDADRVREHRFVVRRAHPGERLRTLDDVERELDPQMLLICDGAGPVGIAGVMGGGNSEVSPTTTSILLEVANFRPGSIRRTSTHLKLRTEASLRFEKGVGPEMAEFAQHRALHLFEQLAGGTVASGLVDAYPGQHAHPTIHVTSGRIEQVLGIAIPATTVTSILSALGFRCEETRDGFDVESPDWRPDVQIPDDVIEDVARIHGYDSLPPTMLRGSLPPVEQHPVEDVRERIRDLAAGLGLDEVINYTLNDAQTLGRLVDPADALRSSPLSVVNPVAAQHQILRTSLRPGLLSSFALNRRHTEGALQLFELGFEYLPVEADLPHERPVFCAVLAGAAPQRWDEAASRTLDFFDAKGVAEALLSTLGVSPTFAPASGYALLDGHTASVSAGDEKVGVVAQVHPATASTFDIDEPIFLVELWLEPLLRALPLRPAYTPPSRFQDVRRDIALLVPDVVAAAPVIDLVRKHRSADIRLTADVFDEYRGPGVDAGHRSLALRVRYQSPDRTLTDADAARVESSLLKRLERELNVTLRT